jgi:FtsH-binding integral membrane protein
VSRKAQDEANKTEGRKKPFSWLIIGIVVIGAVATSVSNQVFGHDNPVLSETPAFLVFLLALVILAVCLVVGYLKRKD